MILSDLIKVVTLIRWADFIDYKNTVVLYNKLIKLYAIFCNLVTCHVITQQMKIIL